MIADASESHFVDFSCKIRQYNTQICPRAAIGDPAVVANM